MVMESMFGIMPDRHGLDEQYDDRQQPYQMPGIPIIHNALVHQQFNQQLLINQRQGVQIGNSNLFVNLMNRGI